MLLADTYSTGWNRRSRRCSLWQGCTTIFGRSIGMAEGLYPESASESIYLQTRPIFANRCYSVCEEVPISEGCWKGNAQERTGHNIRGQDGC